MDQRPCGCPDTRNGYELTEPSTEPHKPECAVQNNNRLWYLRFICCAGFWTHWALMAVTR